MSGTDEGDKRSRGAGRSGTAGSIGKELGDDLDFEADLLLDALLSDVPPAPAKPSDVPEPQPNPTQGDGGLLLAPERRQFPDDEPTWVGNVESAMGIDLKALAEQAASARATAAEDVRDAAAASAPTSPPVPVLPPPPAFSPPRPGGVPRPGGASSVPRPASRPPAAAKQTASGLGPTSAGSGLAAPRNHERNATPVVNPMRELASFTEDDEVTRVQGMPTLRDLEELAEQPEQQLRQSAATTRPPADVQQAHILTSAKPLEELELDQDIRNLPPSSVTTLSSLSDLSFEEPPTDTIEQLLQASTEAKIDVGASADLSDAELEALAAAELSEAGPSEPPQAPLSHTPPPPDSTAPRSVWPDERPAAAHIALDADTWTERAEWLEAEAQAATDPVAKARALLVASELWALVGDTPRAREVATEANSIARSLPLVSRQLRALAAAEQDFKAVAAALELETRSAPTPEARVHAAYLNAEVHRLALKDEVTGKKKLELALRANVDDPRAHLAKLVELLAKGTGPARMRWPESVALAELVQATDESSRLRGAPPPAGGGATTVSPSLVLEQARKSFATGDRGATAAMVSRLAEIEGIGPAALWLAASLTAHDGKTRDEAMSWLERLIGGEADSLARRTLAARALEQGSKRGIRAAAEGENDAFRALDRAILGALSGEGLDTLGPIVDELAKVPSQQPLAAALMSALAETPTGDLLAGSEAARAAQYLGLKLAPEPGGEAPANLASLRAPSQRLLETNPESELARAFELRFAITDRQAAPLLRAVSSLAGTGSEGADARDVNLVSALIEELSGASAAADQRYASAFEADPRAPTPLRALLQSADRDATVRLLGAAADAAGDPAQAALYLLETALRLGPEDAERYDELLHKAAAALPSLQLIHRLGEQQARARGDSERLLSWLRARRAESGDIVGTALDLVREALLVAETEMGLAASLLSDATAARPSDVALRELHERIAASPDEERARWREQLAEVADDETKRELFAQAALEQRRAGNAEAAARSAQAAVALGAGEFVQVLADESALGTTAAARVSESLLALARTTESSAELCELYERLAKLDKARGDHSSALLWQTAILERAPDHLPALRHVEHHYIGKSRLEELEPIAARLAKLTEGTEADAHAHLAARIRIRSGAWSTVRELVDDALTQHPRRLWALRMLEAQARASDDAATTLAVSKALQDRVERPADKATLLLRAAEAAVRTSNLDEAQLLLERALSLVPDHQVILTTLAEVLEQRGDYRAAARALEALAEASQIDAHKVSAWHQAATLWLDRVNDAERGLTALESAVALDITHEDAVVRLQALYVDRGEREKLARLLERRLAHTTDPEERVALEVTRGRALADVGERAQAKAALGAALDANPDHIEALSTFAQLCTEEGDWANAEQAYIRLVRHVPEVSRQALIYRRLGELYDTALPHPERAELAYREVLKRDPEDGESLARLVQTLGRRGHVDKAIELQTEFLGRATTPLAKRDRTLSLALTIEQLGGDRKKAEALLDKARKEAPLDHTILRALVEMHQRHGEDRAATLLLDRAASDARRALVTGRFDPALFEMLAAVAEMRGAHDAASLATATLMALSGEDLPISALGPAAGDLRLDEHLAPDLLSAALRTLLYKAGDLLDAAFAVDLRQLRAAPLPVASQAFVQFVQNVAESFGIRGLEVLSSPSLGPVCMPVSATPPVIVFGQALLDHPDDAARFFLLMRSLKIVQARAAALSRTPPIELPAIVGAFLQLFAPSFVPQGVDAKKLADARAKLQQSMRGRVDDDVPALALEVASALGSRASQLGAALHQWGNRTGLLAVGSPTAALRGLALAAGQLAGPPSGPERAKWVVRNPEARDLAVFSVSDGYAEARARLGVPR